MKKIWKPRFFMVCLAAFLIAAFLLYELSQVDQPAMGIGFVFIFIALITFFPLIIARQRPRLSRYIYSIHLRAPPLH